MRAPGRHFSAGFTIVELVIVIVLMGIVAAAISQLIQRPMESYLAQSRRAELVDIADTALKQMSRELRHALPNSIRIACGGQCLEFLHTLDGARYRARSPGDFLNFTPAVADNQFDILGQLPQLGNVTTGAGNACLSGQADCLVIYNTGQPGANAYNGDNIATITAALDNTAADGSDQLQFDNANFSSGLTAFPNASPRQRFQIVDTPVSYICNLATGEIRRYQDYAISAAQPIDPAAAPLTAANAALLADRVTACTFSYAPGNLSRSGLAMLQLTLSDSAESITLIQQAHPVNLP